MNKQDFIKQVLNACDKQCSDTVYITFRHWDLELNTKLSEFRDQMKNINITDDQDINIVEINNNDEWLNVEVEIE